MIRLAFQTKTKPVLKTIPHSSRAQSLLASLILTGETVSLLGTIYSPLCS